MNLQKIKALQNKARREAEKAVKGVYKQYDAQMAELIKEQLKDGERLVSGNGRNWLYDAKNEMIAQASSNNQMAFLRDLQYTDQFFAGFLIPQEIVVRNQKEMGVKQVLKEAVSQMENEGVTGVSWQQAHDIVYYKHKRGKAYIAAMLRLNEDVAQQLITSVMSGDMDTFQKIWHENTTLM